MRPPAIMVRKPAIPTTGMDTAMESRTISIPPRIVTNAAFRRRDVRRGEIVC